ncbi:MAG: glycosyltransferase family 39 protein [Planctomycetota bacterium]
MEVEGKARTSPATAGLVALALLPAIVGIFAGIVGPEDLDQSAQDKQLLYVLDIRESGNVVLPLEQGCKSPTKPPLYPWAMTLLGMCMGGPTAAAGKVTAGLMGIATAWLLFLMAAERWGGWAGVGAAWMFTVSHITMGLLTHIRPDMALALCVTAAFFALHREEIEPGRGSSGLFWAGVSLSVLAKWPVGAIVVLGTCAVLFVSREWRKRVWRIAATRWVLLLLLPAGWFALACVMGGTEYLKNAVLPETVERALAVGSRAQKKAWWPGYLALGFLIQFAPWSVFTVGAVVELVWRRINAQARRLAVLPCAWFLTGLVFHNLFRGQRADYLLPFLPAAAMCAAWVMREGAKGVRGVLLVMVGLGAVGAAFLGIAALAGLERALPGVGRLFGATRWGWGGALVFVGAALACVAVADRRTAGELLRSRAFRALTAGFLVIHVFYGLALSPVARTGGTARTRAFADEVNALRSEGDEIVFYGALSKAIRFLVRVNEPALALHEIPWRLEACRDGARFFVITTGAGEREIAESRAGRFREVLRRRMDVGEEDVYVLLEFVGGRGMEDAT